MNAKEKLKYLMGAKARRLWLLGVKNWHLYYTPQDAEEIDQWDEDRANEIWYLINKEVFEYSTSGLTASTCPWCQGFGCSTCQYKKRHFACCVGYSDFQKIIRPICVVDRICFPNWWYRQIIDHIERR